MAKTIKGIKVGSTTISASFTDGGVTKTASKTITVVKATGSVSTIPVNANVVYGSGNKLCSAGSGTGTMMYRVGSTGNFSSTIPTTSGLNAGTYTLYYYAAESDSYNQSSTGSISVTVTQKEVGLSWGETLWVYDGSTHSTTCSATGLVGSDTCTVNLSNNSVGPAKNTSGVTVTASSLSNSNYKLPSSKTTTIKINARPVRYVATDQSKAYDGSKLSANNTASLTAGTYSGTKYYELVSGHTATITGSGSTSAATAGSTGTKTISVVIKSGSTDVSSNYAITTVNGTLSITKASGSVSTAPTNAAATYGSGSNLCSAGSGTGTMQYKLDSGSWSSTIPTATTSVSAGNHTLYYRAAESTNYYQSGEGSITVTVAKKGVTVTWGATSWTYDGSAHSTTCSISSGVISGTSCSVSLSGNTIGKNVGTTTVTASLSNDNYTISSGGTSKTLSITAKVVTLSWGTLTWVYDGSTHSTTCVVSNLVSGDSCTVTLEGNSVGKNVGTSTVTATSLNNANYTLIGASNTSKTLSITQANGSGSVTMTGWTYGGTVTNPTPSSSTNGTSSVTYTWYNSNKSALSSKPGSTSAAGTYYVRATFAATINYKAYTTDYVSFTIAQKEVGLSWGTSTWTYDGYTHSTTCSATGLVGSDTCTVNLSNNSVGKNVGSQTVTASSLSNSNYKLPSSKTKTISITAREVTLTWGTTSWVYDGSAHSTTCTAGNLVSGDTCTVNLSNNSVGKNVGSQTVTASSLNNSNYKLPTSGLTKSISITQKEVTLTWGTTSWVYDGNPHSTTCTLGGIVTGDTCTLALGNNSITYVGSTTVTTTLNNSNYKLPSTNTKSISVTQRTPSITVTGVSKEYTGSSYYAQITKSDAKGTLYWKFGSVPTTSSYGGRTDISSVGTPVGNPSALSTPINVTSVQDVTNQTLYWIFVPSSSLTITTGQTYAANFNNSASGNVTMKITAAAITIPTPTGYTGTYDANSHSATFKSATGAGITKYRYDANGGSSWTETTSVVSRTSVGTTTVQAYYTADSNHSGSGWSSTASIKINQKAVTVTAGSASMVYNGSTLTKADGTTASGLITGHNLTSYTNTGSQTYVGSSNNVPSGAVIKDGSGNTVTSNYAITYAPGKLTITKANPQIAIQGITVDYTGGQFYAKVTGTKAKGTLYWKKGSAASASDSAVAINSTGTPLSTPINITSVKNNLDDFVMYWYFVPSSVANSLASGHTYAENYNTSGGTSEDKVNLTINPREMSNVTASATTVTYNGSQQTANVSISDSGATLTANDYTISGNTGTNATSYTITITGRNNYTGTKTITWTINKRPVTITADSASKTYDGTALTKNSVTASAQDNTKNTGMISSHHVHTWTVSGSQTTAGSSYNTVTAATIYNGASSTHGGSGDTTNVTDNYDITFAKGTLTVNKRAVTYKANDESKVYNGSKLTASNTATLKSGSLPSNHTATFTCTGEIGPGVSSGTKTLSGVVIKNGSGVDVSSSFAITKNPGTLKITNASITYTNTSPVSEDCTKTAVAATKTLGDVSISIASASATDYSGAAITSGSNPSVEGYTISQSGWSISSDGKTITVPANVAAGTYNITVTAAKPNHTPKENGIEVTIKPVTLTSLEMELNSYKIAYGSSTTVKTLTAKYSNNATKSVLDNATYSSSPTGIVTIS